MRELTIEQAEKITLSELTRLIFQQIKEQRESEPYDLTKPYDLIRGFLPDYRQDTPDERIKDWLLLDSKELSFPDDQFVEWLP